MTAMKRQAFCSPQMELPVIQLAYATNKTTGLCSGPWTNNAFKLPDLTQHLLIGAQHGRRFQHMVSSTQHALRPNTLQPLSINVEGFDIDTDFSRIFIQSLR